jgi:DNA-binding XRE family transcriptional regulator
MAVNIQTIIKRLPKKDQQKIKARANELIGEEMNLQGLRKAQQLTQSELAVRLGVKQAEVSRLEQRTDMYISTLYSCVKALGGNLRIIAEFPERSTKVSQLSTHVPVKAKASKRSSSSNQSTSQSGAKPPTRKTHPTK